MMQSEPVKRGRPPAYATKAERNAAHAAAKREAREQKRLRRKQRQMARTQARHPDHFQAVINWEATLDWNIKNGARQSVLEYIREELERENDMKEYDREQAREEQRDQKRNAITMEDIERGAWMKRGMFPTDAPKGMGLVLREGDLNTSVVRISDAQQEDACGAGGGKRVVPKGHGLHSHEENHYRKHPEETESQWMDKHFPESQFKLRCYGIFKGRKCPFEAVGILPQDADKPGDKPRFHCYWHSPIHEFRGHESGVFPKE